MLLYVYHNQHVTKVQDLKFQPYKLYISHKNGPKEQRPITKY